MWPFKESPSKEELLGIKTVRVNSAKYKIRRLNPLLDFGASNIPQIFASFHSRRKTEDVADNKKVIRDMMTVVEVGLVSPELVPVGKDEKRGKEEGITVEDLFRDSSTGPQLYIEIVTHSLNRFKGIRGIFFSTLQRYRLFTAWQQSMVSAPATSSLVPANSA